MAWPPKASRLAATASERFPGQGEPRGEPGWTVVNDANAASRAASQAWKPEGIAVGHKAPFERPNMPSNGGPNSERSNNSKR